MNQTQEKTTEISTCVICTSEKEMISLSCNHKMCQDCLVKHVRVSNKCPFCRTQLSDESVSITEDDHTTPTTSAIEFDMPEDLTPFLDMRHQILNEIASSMSSKLTSNELSIAVTEAINMAVALTVDKMHPGVRFSDQ